MRINTKLAKRLSSNILLKTQLLITKKKLPDCFADFIVLLSLLPQDQLFTYKQIESIARRYFKRLFNNTTIKRKKIKPFPYFFKLLQTNFYHKDGLIKKVDTNLYKVNHLQSTIQQNNPHLSLFSAFIDINTIKEYKYNCSELIKDCIYKCIERLASKTNSQAQFTNRQIKHVFGLTKTDLRKRLNETSSKIKYSYRTIGSKEAYDLELNQNLFKGNHKYINAFQIDITKLKKTNLKIVINEKSLYTVLKRLERQQFSFSVKDFYYYYDSSVAKSKSEYWTFTKQYERLGYKLYNSINTLYRLKEYVEVVNLGVYKQCENIYQYLKSNFDELYNDEIRTFKSSIKSLKCKHIFQLPASSL